MLNFDLPQLIKDYPAHTLLGTICRALDSASSELEKQRIQILALKEVNQLADSRLKNCIQSKLQACNMAEKLKSDLKEIMWKLQ